MQGFEGLWFSVQRDQVVFDQKAARIRQCKILKYFIKDYGKKSLFSYYFRRTILC